MKNLSIYALVLTVFSGYAQEVEPKAFYKGCLVTSITGGPSRVLFTTYDGEGTKVRSDMAKGIIDPLIMEYGINDKIGVGFSRGGENYNIDANAFYNADMAPDNQMMWTRTRYLTADISYHTYATKRLDVSVFGSAGYFKVAGAIYQPNYDYCVPSDPLFKYEGGGAVIRGGIRTRAYFSKRFGVMAMAYAFNGIAKEKAKPNPVADQPNKTGYTSVLCGGGLEFGICFRLFKQKGVKQEVKKTWAEKWNERLNNSWARSEKEEDTDEKPLFRLVWD